MRKEQIVHEGEELRLVDPVGRKLWETPEPEQRYMVVDVRAGVGIKRFWASEWFTSIPSSGVSLAKAVDYSHKYDSTVVAPCRSNTRWLVVTWSISRVNFVVVYMSDLDIENKLWHYSEVPSQIKKDLTREQYEFTFEEAIEQYNAIVAMHNLDLVDIHLICADMLKSEKEVIENAKT